MTMTRHLRLIALLLPLWLMHGYAHAAAEDTGQVSSKELPVDITAINPEREVGYHVGDVLTRTLILKVADKYELLPTSIPIPGNQKRYRNKEQGIEIYASDLKHEHSGDHNIYTLRLSYQVFTSSIVAKPAALPPEFVKFTGEGQLYRVRLPSWNFRISPLAVYGSVRIEKDMSQFRGPLLLDDKRQQLTLRIALVVLGLSLLGLLYILGNRSWLPRMGGPFAKAMRIVRKTPQDAAGVQLAVSSLHQAFNQHAGHSVFTAEEVLAKLPQFGVMQAEIQQFFQLSRAVFFDAKAPSSLNEPAHVWLRKFSRRCRDVERGLK